jgi:hypothetical protein
MKKTYAIIMTCLALFMAVILHSCSKSTNDTAPNTSTTTTTTTTTPPAPTTTQLLTSAPWKISTVSFVNTTTQAGEGVATPDSLMNLVLTFTTNNTYTETGPKTVSGTWAFASQANVITLTTTSPATKVNWTYSVTTTMLGMSNNAVVTYINPLKPLQYYLGEGLGFTH